MKILGIETSCDETASAIVEDGIIVHSNVIASQIALHHKTGGVVPEVAAREHVLKIIPVIEQALKNGGVNFKDLDAIAVTYGPGLLSSLIIGVSAACTLAFSLQKTLIPVNHISGHIYANWLGSTLEDPPQFPLVVLTVSGGHNELVLMKKHAEFKILGETLDDAAGEAFDKVARLLGLGYPGGPQISRIAKMGNAKRFKFPKSYLKDSFDFSFSGLKTAVLNFVKEQHDKEGVLSQEFIADCAASFQESVSEILSDKLLNAAVNFNVKEIHLAGGVSANLRLREMVQEKLKQGVFYNAKCHQVKFKPNSFKLRFAKDFSYCTDNAAMIAASAYFHYKKSPKSYNKNVKVIADPNLNLS